MKINLARQIQFPSIPCQRAKVMRLALQTLRRPLFLVHAPTRRSGAKVTFGCVSTGCDHAASNLRLVAHLCARLPPNVLHMPGFCKQHASGLCLSTLTKSFGIASPAFCVSKLFRNDKFYIKFLAGVRLAIADRLVWVKDEDLLLHRLALTFACFAQRLSHPNLVPSFSLFWPSTTDGEVSRVSNGSKSGGGPRGEGVGGSRRGARLRIEGSR